MTDFLILLNGKLNHVVWVYIILPLVLVAGIVLTVKTGGVQILKFGYAMRTTIGKFFSKQSSGKGTVTPLQAVTTALAATVGTGNIVGTCQAITMGGYGSIFWLWVSAFLGMAIKYAEVTLAVHFRVKNAHGDFVGGPMYYIVRGMGNSKIWMARIFSFFTVIASFGIGNMAQANTVSWSVVSFCQNFFHDKVNAGAICVITGVGSALCLAAVQAGGIKRIGRITEIFIPVMSIMYTVFSLMVICVNCDKIVPCIETIFSAAFSSKAVYGCASGIAMKSAVKWGLQRSAFSNEAGLGSAAIAHAPANTDSPVMQGMYGIFEVFLDTIVLCTITAVTVIVSGIEIPWGTKPGTELVIGAFATVFGKRAASAFIAVAVSFFAFSTMIGWSLYGVRSMEFLCGENSAKYYLGVYFAAAALGAIIPADIVWEFSDTFNGLMAIPNFVALFALSGMVKRLTQEHFG